MTPRAGLSLFELLVSLALLALIAAGLGGALNMTLRVHDRTVTAPEEMTEAVLRHRLRHWLQNAVPPNRLAPFPVTFEGDETGFAFTTLAGKEFAPEAAALRVSIQIKGRTVWLNLNEIEDDGTVLKEHAFLFLKDAEIKISYLLEISDTPPWLPNWQNSGQLPKLVKITALSDSQMDPQDYIFPLLAR